MLTQDGAFLFWFVYLEKAISFLPPRLFLFTLMVNAERCSQTEFYSAFQLAHSCSILKHLKSSSPIWLQFMKLLKWSLLSQIFEQQLLEVEPGAAKLLFLGALPTWAPSGIGRHNRHGPRFGGEREVIKNVQPNGKHHRSFPCLICVPGALQAPLRGAGATWWLQQLAERGPSPSWDTWAQPAPGIPGNP